MLQVAQFVWEHKFEIGTALWGVCEILSKIPSIESNSVFQLIENGLKKLLGK